MDDKSKEEQSKKKKNETGANHASKLPAEIVGRFQQNLSVGDRLKTERVSPLWKQALSKWGWIEQAKLNADIVFEGANNDQQIARFWEDLDNHGICHLAYLFNQCGPCLRELNLQSFGNRCLIIWSFSNFMREIAEPLKKLNKLEKLLDIGGLDLRHFVVYLPSTLREFKTTGKFWAEGLEALSDHCPNLEEVPFKDVYEDNLDSVIEMVGKFPRQKRLDLCRMWSRSEKVWTIEPFGQLQELEELDLGYCEFLDGKTLATIVEGCQRLRAFYFGTHRLTEEALFQLAKIQQLTKLLVHDTTKEFTDAVLKAIADRGKLKKLVVLGNPCNFNFTDDSILYLVDRCKSLVSLKFTNCLQIGERSLEAVVAEVWRRHGVPPRTLPTDALDAGIFYYNVMLISERAQELAGDNPWLICATTDNRKII